MSRRTEVKRAHNNEKQTLKKKKTRVISVQNFVGSESCDRARIKELL